MARHGSFLYRRNGIYYARLRVPRDLQVAFGRTHLRASLGTTNYSLARFRVHETVLHWKRAFDALKSTVDAHVVVAGSPLLLGPGSLTIDSAARESGLTDAELVREAFNRRVELRLLARGWAGSEMPADELEFDFDGSLVVDAGDLWAQDFISGELFLRREELAYAVNAGTYKGCLLYRDTQRRRAVVFPLPGVSVPVADLLIQKADAESIRSDLASRVTPEMIKAAKHRRPASASPLPSAPVAPAHKHSTMPASKLVENFLAAKRPTWSAATFIQMEGMCSTFVELMGDPTLGDIDRSLLRRYQLELLKLPSNIYQTARRLGTTTLADLVHLSAGLPRMKEERAAAYVAKIGEAFGWAKREGLMPENPAASLVERKRRTRREQDERSAMSKENLELIFSHSWFKTGTGTRTAKGRHWNFQPHMYWLPLLALYSGGRLNELSQLHISDVRQTPAGTWYLDFNLNDSDKIDADEPDKRLKTVNSERKVPLHAELIRLGLPEYVAALRSKGYRQLFPELRFDRVKGYGKQSGQWFNERFLGKQLKIARNGMQTFHSFRHNFTTALNHLDPPISEFRINQLTGHERGETMSARRYAKDSSPDNLRADVDRLNFGLPAIAKFDIEDGLTAVKAALERKTKATGLPCPNKALRAEAKAGDDAG
jgi:integrase